MRISYITKLLNSVGKGRIIQKMMSKQLVNYFVREKMIFTYIIKINCKHSTGKDLKG